MVRNRHSVYEAQSISTSFNIMKMNEWKSMRLWKWKWKSNQHDVGLHTYGRWQNDALLMLMLNGIEKINIVLICYGTYQTKPTNPPIDIADGMEWMVLYWGMCNAECRTRRGENETTQMKEIGPPRTCVSQHMYVCSVHVDTIRLGWINIYFHLNLILICHSSYLYVCRL